MFGGFPLFSKCIRQVCSKLLNVVNLNYLISFNLLNIMSHSPVAGVLCSLPIVTVILSVRILHCPFSPAGLSLSPAGFVELLLGSCVPNGAPQRNSARACPVLGT